MPVSIAEDDGYLEFAVAEPGGSASKTVRLDLFEASNTYAGMCAQFDPESKPIELAREWRGWLTEHGCPPLSQGAAFRIAGAVWDAVQAYKKKHEIGSPSPDSPASTGSTSPG